MTRNVFITGVSSGIGLALAQEYLREGFSVFGLSRRSPKELAGSGRFVFVSADLSELKSIPGVVDRLLSQVPRLDLVILNAGILGPIGDLQETRLDEILKVMEVNVWANKVILDELFRREIPVTQVVAISSGAAANANRGWNGYSISKAALNMLTALYAAERPETHFCALAPGIVDTAMQAEIASKPEDPRLASFEMLRQARGTPLMPSPDHAAKRLQEGIAKAVKFASGSFLDINTLVKKSWA